MACATTLRSLVDILLTRPSSPACHGESCKKPSRPRATHFDPRQRRSQSRRQSAGRILLSSTPSNPLSPQSQAFSTSSSQPQEAKASLQFSRRAVFSSPSCSSASPLRWLRPLGTPVSRTLIISPSFWPNHANSSRSWPST